MVYLDNAATTKPSKRVIQEMTSYLESDWYNPSSGYRASKKIAQAVELARERVARLIGASTESITFTSGGTESNNMVLSAVDEMLSPEAPFFTSAIEHSAILRPMQALERSGRDVRYGQVGSDGRLVESDLDDVQFATVMWANNETGVLQPLEALRASMVPFHTDAVQVVGKLKIDSLEGVDTLAMSGHKFNGPKGVGALYVRSGMRMQPLLRGGGQEREMRSGTENVPAIIGMGVAAEEAWERLEADPEQLKVAEVRDTFEARVLQLVSGVTVNGAPDCRLPSHTHLSFESCEAAGLVILLDEMGVQCSAGSACMTGKQEPSHVQMAMGLSREHAKSSLRFSFSHENTLEEAELAAEAVQKAVEKLRKVQSRGIGPVVVYTP